MPNDLIGLLGRIEMIHIWFWDKASFLRTAQHDSYAVLYFKKRRKNGATTTKADGTHTLEAVLLPVSAVDHLAVKAKASLLS